MCLCLVSAQNSRRSILERVFCLQFRYVQVNSSYFHVNCYLEWRNEILRDLSEFEINEIFVHAYHKHLKTDKVFENLESNPLNVLDFCSCCEAPVYQICEVDDNLTVDLCSIVLND